MLAHTPSTFWCRKYFTRHPESGSKARSAKVCLSCVPVLLVVGFAARTYSKLDGPPPPHRLPWWVVWFVTCRMQASSSGALPLLFQRPPRRQSFVFCIACSFTVAGSGHSRQRHLRACYIQWSLLQLSGYEITAAFMSCRALRAIPTT